MTTRDHAPRPAVFLDRDGTIIHDANYIRTPAQVHFIPGAAAAVRRLNEAGLPVVVVTNQSGIARGILTEVEYDAVRERLDELLAREGACVDASYYCPHLPELTGPCECRKPGTLLHRRAAEELGLDLGASAYIGDRWRDVEPALRFGGLGILVPSDGTPREDVERAEREAEVMATLEDAVRRVIGR